MINKQRIVHIYVYKNTVLINASILRQLPTILKTIVVKFFNFCQIQSTHIYRNKDNRRVGGLIRELEF